MNIHELDIVHRDFHPGNILSSNFKDDCVHISDFGLIKLIWENPNNPEKRNNIFGVLPYIAPEVLSGDEEYTKAADVYSYGIVAYEIVIGFPPYPDIPHDKDLAMKICNGLRPKIPFHTPKLITKIITIISNSKIFFLFYPMLPKFFLILLIFFLFGNIPTKNNKKNVKKSVKIND
ncbi:hypothetical protein Glove_213g86 [Diversispora epigaea]|uniref:Protein kinase domain-containing protein n=1 Tax=Diversispora epigaea TaxID=1348612 RepID=A0A397IKI4_9GLOM|nr:hypothetical protein Glove_213g86 [Diversispora epigaea]